MPRRTARVAAAVPPAPPDRKSQTPAAAGRRSLRGTAGVAAGGSGEGKDFRDNGWSQRTWPPAPVADGKGKAAVERREKEVDAILEFGSKAGQPNEKRNTKQSGRFPLDRTRR